MTEDEKGDTRHAGWMYLVASHIGTAFLLVLFVLPGKAIGGCATGDDVTDARRFPS